MSVKRLLIFTFLALAGAAASGCSDDNDTNGAGGGNAPALKPLPDACDDKELLPLNFTWNSANNAFGYTIEFGYLNSAPFATRYADGDATSYSYAKARRGRTYRFSVSLQRRDGDYRWAEKVVEIPKCAERRAFQKANPKYAEPLDFVITF